MKAFKNRQLYFLFFLCFFGRLLGAESSYEVFSKIDEANCSGTNFNAEGDSRHGSLLEQTQEYRQFLQQFLKDQNIQSVIDIRSGDGTFSQASDWNSVQYYEFDLAGSVIEKNKVSFGSSSIQFAQFGGPEKVGFSTADLLLCKDVLQHLPYKDIEQFLQNLNKFKYCLITTDIGPSNLDLGSFDIPNIDIKKGDHRFLDLTQPPFSVQAKKVLTYRAGPYWKQVLVIQPQLNKKPDVTLVGPVGCESLCQFPGLWAGGLSDDIDIHVIPTFCINEEANAKLKDILSIKDRPPGKIGILLENVWWEGANNYEIVPKDCDIKIAYSSYESSKLHPKWVEIFNEHFDAVAVLDPYFKDVYVSSGVTVPVFVLPHGLDLKKFQEYPNRRVPSRPLVFGCSAAFWERKNLPLLAKSFAKEFGNSPQVKLKIHGRGGQVEVINELNQIVQQYGLENAEIICKRLAAQDYVDFMNSLDVYVLASQGEGYSISPREAMALGIPCILSDNTAHKTLNSSGFVKAVKSKKRIVPPNYLGSDTEKVGFMFETEEADLRKAMREMYENYATYLAQAEKGREWVKKYDMTTLKPSFLALIKPKKVVLGDSNTLENEVLTTTSKALFDKYISLK